MEIKNTRGFREMLLAPATEIALFLELGAHFTIKRILLLFHTVSLNYHNYYINSRYKTLKTKIEKSGNVCMLVLTL